MTERETEKMTAVYVCERELEFGLVYGTSTIVGYLMPNPFLCI